MTLNSTNGLDYLKVTNFNKTSTKIYQYKNIQFIRVKNLFLYILIFYKNVLLVIVKLFEFNNIIDCMKGKTGTTPERQNQEDFLSIKFRV